MPQGEPINWVKVKTTLPTVPYAPVADRPTIMTERLLMRPWREDDFEHLRSLRTQHEVMRWSMYGKVDKDIEKTKEIFASKFPPSANVTHHMAVWLRSTGEFIGHVESHNREGRLGWPELAYQLKKEHWGHGYATEFAQAFLAFWWSLPRSEVELTVEKATVIEDPETGLAKECIVAMTIEENKASRNVMQKSGLQLVKVWRTTNARDPTTTIDLYCHTVQAPTQKV